ncbi:MAG: N-6 DNA methylase [Nitrososphaera sp.]|nr:N-6 DNA methylase [Nitrososphaera sp.]
MANVSANVIPLVPVGKIRCFVTGQLRPDKPEEHVRQRWARSLVEEYKYERGDLDLEFKIKMGIARKSADIVILKVGGPRQQDAISIIVEAKRADVLPKDKTEGIEQLRSYMAACSSCRYGLWVGSEKVAFEKLDNGLIVETTDIPRYGDSDPQPPEFDSLSPAVDLKAAFRRCHNYIYVNQGIQKAEAFHELQKLIFCKVHDEYETTGTLRFFIRGDERRSEAGQRRVLEERIAPLFEEVKERYPYIFEGGEKIKLNRRVLSYIVSELQRYSLLRTNTDVKGAAYEELVGENLRGDRGEFFTPRNVCDMAVRMALSLFSKQRLTSLKVLDCCCGTGGFLVSAINRLRDAVTGFETRKGGPETDIRARVSARVKEIAERNLFGMDINPFLVRTTQMNLVMHGDGSVNVFSGDSLVAPGEWEDETARKKITPGTFDICVTNPPFGGRAIVDDPHVLSRYELPIGNVSVKSSMPSEQLFVEAALKYVKPGGYLAIVLPDSILNNPGLEFIREWIFRRARIMASVDLPKETFAMSGGVPNPSVLLLQRLGKEEIKLAEADALDDYEVFMSIPRTAGQDKRGNPIYYRTPDGFEILNEQQEPCVDDEIPMVADSFMKWRLEMGYGTT